MKKEINMIREQNLNAVKHYFFTQKSALKSEVAEKTTISIVTMNSLVKQLVEANVLIEGDKIKPNLGRPSNIYHFNYNQTYFLLVSVEEITQGNEKKLALRANVANLAGEVFFEETRLFATFTIAYFLELIEQFLDQVEEYPIKKIGISFPGKVYQKKIVSSWYNKFNDWELETRVEEYFKLPTFIQNDAHLVTIGSSLLHRIDRKQTIVGIFYPDRSMPGITLFAQGHLIEGRHHLAGEAKYLPNLINQKVTESTSALKQHLVEILEMYNAVIAPDRFIISAEAIKKSELEAVVRASTILAKQINTPKIFIEEQFALSLKIGLLWLVTPEEVYYRHDPTVHYN